jgi:glycosyltransferase involved in cell wall biosynthesis
MTAGKKRRETRILHIVGDERLGGPQWRTLELAKRLKEDGFFTIVAMPEGEKTFANLLDATGIPHYQIRSFKRLPSSLNPLTVLVWFLYFIPGVVSVTRLIRRNRVDIVHVNGFLALRQALAARIAGAKLLWYLSETLTPKPLKTLLLPFLYLLPNKVAMSSKAVGRYYLGEGTKLANEATILYHPIDTSKFCPDHNVEKCRREFGLKLEDRVVGIVGNISPTKGYEYLFPAAKMIKEAFPNVKFLVVGGRLKTREKYWEKLQTLIAGLGLEKDLIMTGFRMDIPEMINSMDIFVLSSVTEGGPRVVLEAMACAKPIVATDVGLVPEVVVDGEIGIVVPSRDSKAIARAVLYLLSHPEEAREMGEKGRRRIMEQFNSEMTVQRYKKTYEEVLSR